MTKAIRLKPGPRPPRLPTTIEAAEAALFEAQAVAFARVEVRMVLDDKVRFLGQPVSWFEREDSRQFWKRFLKITATSPDGLLDLYENARDNDELSHEVMCELINEHHHSHTKMPAPLETYDMQVVRAAGDPSLRKPRKRGPKKRRALLRDIALLYLVGAVRWKTELKGTRSGRTRLSACLIVARALEAEGKGPSDEHGVSEDTVVAVWTRWKHLSPPDDSPLRSFF
jgi:hypothetical protein